MNATDIGPRGWLIVLSGTACLVLLSIWLFGTGTIELVTGLLAVAAALVLVVTAVVDAIAVRRPGIVLASLAFLGVGAVLTAVVFGFAYLGDSLAYLRGDPATAEVLACEVEEGGELDGDDCESRWEVGGREYTGEVELSFAQQPGDTMPVHAEGDRAVRGGGLTVLVVGASGVAVVSPLLVLAAYVSVRRSRSA